MFFTKEWSRRGRDGRIECHLVTFLPYSLPCSLFRLSPVRTVGRKPRIWICRHPPPVNLILLFLVLLKLETDQTSSSEALTSVPEQFLFFSILRRKQSNMLEGKALVQDTDMPVKMQIQAMTSASQALDLYDVCDCTRIAGHIKKEFDKIYGSGWQCVVGSNFGCYFTHSRGSFIYFCLETLNFLIFKGAS